jgi:hypothetical protein
VETARTTPFIKGDAPAVAVRPCRAAAARQSCKGKADVGWDIRVHAKKFTHSPAYSATKAAAQWLQSQEQGQAEI